MKQRRSPRGPKNEGPRVARELPLSGDDVTPSPRLPPHWMRRPDVPSGDPADRRIGASPSPKEPQRTWWGEVGIFAGGAAIAATLYAGHPNYGAGPLGWWKVAGIAVGLLAVAAGLVAAQRDSTLRVTLKMAVVVVAVIAVGALAYSVEQFPATLQGCATADGPTLEDRGPVYCQEGDGTLVRTSISSVHACRDGKFSYVTTVERRWGQWPESGWATEWSVTGCPL